MGDREYMQPLTADSGHDIDLETHLLFNRIRRVPTVRAQLRVLGGGHDWDVWLPAFREGIVAMFRRPLSR